MLAYVDDRVEGSHRFMARICAAAVEAVRADAVGLSLTSRRTGSVITFSDGLPSEDLQQRLHLIEQSPNHDATDSDCVVLISDLAALEAMTRFPEYASAALEACVRSVSVIPLGTAEARLGTLEFYRYWPESLAGEELDAALAFAAKITDVLRSGPAQHNGALRWPAARLSA